MQRTPLERLAVLAGWVFIADFATKEWALHFLTDHGDRLALPPGLHLALVNNTRLGGGLEVAGFELQVTAVVTLALIAIVVRTCNQLAAVDAAAPTMLGLLLGAGTANLADALIPPKGVVDFIAISLPGNGDLATVTFNVADIAAAVGLVLCCRTVLRIAQTVRGRRPIPALRRAALAVALQPMRQRVLIAGGHALLAMCGFVWLYSMVIALTPDAGRSAPSSLICGVAVFAAVFATSSARLWLAARREVPVSAPLVEGVARPMERVVLDGSLAVVRGASTDLPRPPKPRREKDVPVAPRQAAIADREGEARSDR